MLLLMRMMDEYGSGECFIGDSLADSATRVFKPMCTAKVRVCILPNLIVLSVLSLSIGWTRKLSIKSTLMHGKLNCSKTCLFLEGSTY
jgi:hypothetical protein